MGSRTPFTSIGLLAALLALPALGAQEVVQTFSLDGQLFGDLNSTTPLVDTGNVVLQVMDTTQACVLYEETQSFDTRSTNGKFTVEIGSAVGSGKRTGNDSGNSMSLTFSNVTSTPINGKTIAGAPCTYTPTSGDVRYLRAVVTPSSDNNPRVLSPNLTLDSVPSAVVSERSESLRGLTPQDFLQLGTATGLTQSNLEFVFSTSNNPALLSLLNGTSPTYVTRSTNGAENVPTASGNLASATMGQFWYDTSTNVLKYYNGSTYVSLAAGGFVQNGNAFGATAVLGTTDAFDLNLITGGTTALSLKSNGTATIGGGTPNSRFYVSTDATDQTATKSSLRLRSKSGAGTTADVMIVRGDGSVGIGTTSPGSMLEVANTLSASGVDSGPSITVVNKSSTATRFPTMNIVNYGGSTPGSSYLNVKNARGAQGAGVALQTGDAMGGISMQGFTGVTWSSGASVSGLASETYTTTAQGSELMLSTTLNGTNIIQERVRISNQGFVGVLTPTPQAQLDVNGLMRLKRYSSTPTACAVANDGAIGLTSQSTLCVCKGASGGWVSANDGVTPCTW